MPTSSTRRVVISAGIAAAILATLYFTAKPLDAPHSPPVSNSPSAAAAPVTAPVGAGPVSTQGQLARALAARFGMGSELSEDRAIGLLASRGIMPEAGWNKTAPATEAVISSLQKTLHTLLTNVANDTGAQVPPTLNMLIFDPQKAGGQTFQISGEDIAALLPGRGTVRESDLRRGVTTAVRIAAPHPFPAGDDRLPPVWTYRLRHPGAAFIRLHFAQLDMAPPTHVVVLDRYGQERWRWIGGDARTADVWADAVAGDTAIIVLHAGAVPAGAGLVIDSYTYGLLPGPPRPR